MNAGKGTAKKGPTEAVKTTVRRIWEASQKALHKRERLFHV